MLACAAGPNIFSQASIKATKNTELSAFSEKTVRPGERLNMTLLDLEKAYSEILEEVVASLMNNSNGLTALLSWSTYSLSSPKWDQSDVDSKTKAGLVPFWRDLREYES